ncbi:MAG: glucans biosynthesis glucosyltransferase [Caulobacteraceae bacterium]|jgi:membrane glycosyltransferase|nr:glucans biosynthesis glucosyltransferase [Caulobacteraceae bacterium]
MTDDCARTPQAARAAAPEPAEAASLVLGPAWLPVEAPLPMAAQDLTAPPRTVRPLERGLGECDLWRTLAFALTAVAMVAAGIPSHDVLQIDGFTPLEMVSFVLFELLFGWVTFSLMITLFGVAGAVAHEPELAELKPETPLPRSLAGGRTAILMPIHNEDPGQVFSRLRTMRRSLRDLGAQAAFDVFVLSDSRDPDIARAEVAAFAHLRAEDEGGLFYRRRALNQGRKAGNIADWVRRFGGAYDHMVVLDADSLMSGEALARLAAAMQAHPGVGLIQTAPRLVGRTSLFGRLQQFASRLYGPVMTNGLALLWGSEGNYWGHNAIIRVRAFADQAGLPTLEGRRPFGGDIMSHDFVEAALLRRAGWAVRIAPRLTGSYEECPPTLPDLIARDRRWCQGNVQHLGLVGARGLHWMSRFHMIQGALGYLMSPLWLGFLVISALMAMESHLTASGEWDMYSIRVLRWVLSTTFTCLFIPRLIALGLTLSKPSERRSWGRPDRLVLSVLLETALSALIAPIMMLSQTKALFDILRGRDAGWSAQKREDGSIVWRDALRHHSLHAVAGVVLGLFLYWVSPMTFAWAIPVVAGLVLAAPLAVLTADPALGALFLRWELFVTPEEILQPHRAPPREEPAEARPGLYGPAVAARLELSA